VLPQSEATLHIAPGACLVPHKFVTVLHATPTHWLSRVQVDRHWVELRHLYGPQSVMLGVQAPVPLHVEGDFRMLATPAVALSVHDCRLQVVVAS